MIDFQSSIKTLHLYEHKIMTIQFKLMVITRKLIFGLTAATIYRVRNLILHNDYLVLITFCLCCNILYMNVKAILSLLITLSYFSLRHRPQILWVPGQFTNTFIIIKFSLVWDLCVTVYSLLSSLKPNLQSYKCAGHVRTSVSQYFPAAHIHHHFIYLCIFKYCLRSLSIDCHYWSSPD